jgi:hypothetical protein
MPPRLRSEDINANCPSVGVAHLEYWKGPLTARIQAREFINKMILPSVLFLTLLVDAAFSSFVFFPLYISPGTAWNPLYDAVGKNLGLQFTLIINPNSGPGSGSCPSSGYVTAIDNLNKYPNVQLLGYTHTSYTTRSQSAVLADVNTYANWSKCSTTKDVHMDGIFFDEAPAQYSTSSYNYMSQISNTARNSLSYVAFNPGTMPDSRYFDLADNICVWEDAYSHYSSNAWSPLSQAQRKKSSILIHTFTANANTQKSLVNTIESSGVAGLYITTVRLAKNPWGSFSSLWSAFVTAMAS